MDDAQDNIGEIQDRVRKIVRGGEGDGERLRDWIALSPKDFDRQIQKAVERVFKLLDLPRRTDLEMLNANLERVAEAIERLEGRRRETTAGAETEAAAEEP
jgi:hypothetical protein